MRASRVLADSCHQTLKCWALKLPANVSLSVDSHPRYAEAGYCQTVQDGDTSALAH